MNRLLPINIFACVILLVGCATTKTPKISDAELEKETAIQKKLELTNTLRYQKRLDDIAYPVMRGGYSYCNDETTSGLGMRVANTSAFPEELRHAAAEALDLGRTLKVLWTIDNGPAARAGINPGDEIVRINDKALFDGKNALVNYRDALQSTLKKNTQLTITVRRNDRESDYVIVADKICDYPVIAILDATPNAYADGSMIAVNSGLLRLFENNRDVAIVIGHELAHNVKEHAAKGLAASILGAIVELALDIDEVGGVVSAPFSPPLEAEADYVGLYIAANAGIDIEGAEDVWRTFAMEFSGAKEKTLLDSHPPTPERYLALRKTIQEINKKKANHLPLKPEK